MGGTATSTILTQAVCDISLVSDDTDDPIDSCSDIGALSEANSYDRRHCTGCVDVPSTLSSEEFGYTVLYASLYVVSIGVGLKESAVSSYHPCLLLSATGQE